jgi:hypothetical protein
MRIAFINNKEAHAGEALVYEVRSGNKTHLIFLIYEGSKTKGGYP